MLNKAKNIFIVGIKGVAMANLALILRKMGKNVTGSDVSEEFITDELLKKNKISYTIGFNPDDLPKKTDIMIYSASHQGTDNLQIKEGQRRGIKVQSQAEVLGQLSRQFETTIAVCGCHGKTTTSSLLSYSLLKLGEKPSYLVGAPQFNEFWGGDYQTKKYFIIEADEYGVNPPIDKTPKFHFLRPRYIICTNIDFDHPDVYKNIEEVKMAFLKFFQRTYELNAAASKSLLIFFFCADDENLMDVAKKLPRGSYLTFGFDKKADFRIVDAKTDQFGSSFNLIINQGLNLNNLKGLNLKFLGGKNIANAAGVVSLLLYLGYSPEKIKKAIADFVGAKRRFEKIAFVNSIYLFDDYAHHPKEIEATINAVRQRFPKRRIIIIFQPHTYSRTRALLKEFAHSLSLADVSFILPIFPSAREDPKAFQITSEHIVAACKGRTLLKTVRSSKGLMSQLPSTIEKGDVVFTMGAGDVYKLKDDIIEVMKKIV